MYMRIAGDGTLFLKEHNNIITYSSIHRENFLDMFFVHIPCELANEDLSDFCRAVAFPSPMW